MSPRITQNAAGAKFLVRFNGHAVRFREVGVRKMFEVVAEDAATLLTSEAEGWARVQEYNVRPLPLVTVEEAN